MKQTIILLECKSSSHSKSAISVANSRDSKLTRAHSSSSSVRSIVSRRSKASSIQSKVSNLSLRQRAKVEGLKAEAEAIKRTNEAELKAKLLRVQQRIEKAKAIERVYNDELLPDVERKSTKAVETGIEGMTLKLERKHRESNVQLAL